MAFSSPMRAMTSPTSMVSSSSARISTRVPATGEGISVSTLSVETSSNGSSTSTVSPTDLSHWVMVPSVTDSPSSGISTSAASPEPPLEESAFGSSFFSSASSSPLSAEESLDAEPASSSSPIMAMTSPTSMVSSSSALISIMVPATGEGISVSTLSVETSSNGSSTSTVSPTDLSHCVMVPSVTDSPSSGISTEFAMSYKTPRKLEVFYRYPTILQRDAHPRADVGLVTTLLPGKLGNYVQPFPPQ